MLPLTEHTTRLTGEFPTPRRRAIDIANDAPPEVIRQGLRAEVEDSLRSVCSNWPTGEFDRIVANVTATAMKYHGRERRRQTQPASHSTMSYIPGATVVMSLVMSATHSVQKFLHLETLPSG